MLVSDREATYSEIIGHIDSDRAIQIAVYVNRSAGEDTNYHIVEIGREAARELVAGAESLDDTVILEDFDRGIVHLWVLPGHEDDSNRIQFYEAGT